MQLEVYALNKGQQGLSFNFKFVIKDEVIKSYRLKSLKN